MEITRERLELVLLLQIKREKFISKLPLEDRIRIRKEIQERRKIKKKLYNTINVETIKSYLNAN